MAIRAATKEWAELPISKLAKFSRGVSWRKSEESKDGILVVSIPNIKNGRIDFKSKYNHYITKEVPKSKELQIDDIIFVGSSGSIQNVGRNAMVRELPADVTAFASFAFNARPDRSNVDPTFLYYLCNSSQVPFDKYTKRAADGKYNFQLRDFEKNLKLKVPPISEQIAIARVLTTIQDAITDQERLIVKLKELKRSMMHYLFTHGIKGEKTKMTEIGEIPESWDAPKLGEVCDTSSGGTPSRTKKEYFLGSIPWIKSGEMNDGYISDSEEKITPEAVESSSAKMFESGTLLIAMYGATAGKTAIISRDATTNQAICGIFKNNKVDLEFIRYALILRRGFLLDQRHGGAQPNLSQTSIRNLRIPLPTVEEQEKISSSLIAIEKKIVSTRVKLACYQSLFKTLLHELMSGERRVGIKI